jgi:type III secretory pathway lipoprotein EscJ
MVGGSVNRTQASVAEQRAANEGNGRKSIPASIAVFIRNRPSSNPSP